MCGIFKIFTYKIISSAKRILLLLFHFGYLSFSSLIALSELQILCWAEMLKVCILGLVLILEEMLSALNHWRWWSLWVFTYSLLCWSSFLLFLVWMLSWKSVEFLFLLDWDDHADILPSFCWYGVLLFWSVEPSLHVRNKSYLFMVYSPFNMLLNPACCILLKVLASVFLPCPYPALVSK